MTRRPTPRSPGLSLRRSPLAHFALELRVINTVDQLLTFRSILVNADPVPSRRILLHEDHLATFPVIQFVRDEEDRHIGLPLHLTVDLDRIRDRRQSRAFE